MKENQEYKNEALAALKGRWAPSVLAVLAYMAVLAVFIAPYEIKAMQLSYDPTNLQLAADMMKWYPVFILGCIFVSFPLLVGLVNGFKSLFTDGDDKVLSNEFKIGFGNYWHHVWGHVPEQILRLPLVASAFCAGDHKDPFLCDDELHSCG